MHIAWKFGMEESVLPLLVQRVVHVGQKASKLPPTKEFKYWHMRCAHHASKLRSRFIIKFTDMLHIVTGT